MVASSKVHHQLQASSAVLTCAAVTRDHEPNEEPEKSGVVARGGTVAWHDTPSGGGVWRVNGDLCMSRSFGDPRCKPAVCCVPDVSVKSPLPQLVRNPRIGFI